MNSNIQSFMKDHRVFQEYLQKNGVVLSNEHDLNGKANSFSINETQLNFAISEYNTTATLELCLSFFLPNFTFSEIRQVISMFEFHYHLFCLKPDENEVFNVIVTNNHITFNSKIIGLQMTQNDFELYQDFSFFESAYTIKKISIESFQKVITKQLKKSLSLYFKSNIKQINNELINNILNESIEKYDNRINNKHFFKKWSDHIFFKNIDDNLTYVLKSYLYQDEEEVEPIDRLENKNIAIIKQDIEHSVIELNKLQERINILVDANKTQIIRKLFQPVFIESELDYLISIISLMDFMEKIDNPYASKNVLFIDKEPTQLKSKDDVFCANYIFNISVGDFSLNIGRETEIRSYSLYEYTYKSDKFKSIYNSLVNLFKKEISKSLDITINEITNQHIKLQQMKNS